MEDGELIAQVERRPAIWDPRTKDSDARQNRAAWRQLCKSEHPDFDDLPPADKRDKCLALQKRWQDLRQAYYRSLRSGRRRSSSAQSPSAKSELLAKMAFLGTVVPGAESSPVDVDADDNRPSSAKRPRSDSTASASTHTSLTPEADEDRHFLLSLVSYMQDVPRQNRLALRRDMIALVAKYSEQTTPTATSTSTTSTSSYHQQ